MQVFNRLILYHFCMLVLYFIWVTWEQGRQKYIYKGGVTRCVLERVISKYLWSGIAYRTDI